MKPLYAARTVEHSKPKPKLALWIKLTHGKQPEPIYSQHRQCRAEMWRKLRHPPPPLDPARRRRPHESGDQGCKPAGY